MAPPTIREAISNNTGAQIAIGGTFTVTKPASLADNDEVRLFVCGNNETFTITPPAGWTAIGSVTNVGNNAKIYGYSRKIGTVAGEPAWTFTVNVTATRIIALGHAFGGASSVITDYSTNTGSSTTPTALSVNNPVADSVAIMVVYNKQNTQPQFSAWSAVLTTEDYDNKDTNGASGGMAHGTIAATGATGNLQCTSAGNVAWATFLILVENPIPIRPCRGLMGVGI